MRTEKTEWIRVSRNNLCPICSKPDWCSLSADGNVVLCMRVQSPRPGRTWGWIHALNGRNRHVRHFQTAPRKRLNAITAVFPAWKGWDSQTTDKNLLKLSNHLGVEPHSLKLLGCVWCPDKLAYGFPMFQKGKMSGVRFRTIDGDKWSLKGGREGLFVPKLAWKAMLYICEGPTDTAAALSIGLAAIGRPSCMGSMELVNEFIALKKISRAVVVADDDEPGQAGANRLQDSLRVPSVIWTPPAKDLREFVCHGGEKILVETIIKNLVWTMPKNS